MTPSSCRPRAHGPYSNDASRSLDQYKVYKQLYRGQVSMVLEAMDRRTGAHVVLKVYSKRLMDNVDRRQLEREMDIHSSLDHENVVDLIAVFEDDLACCLVQRFAKGGDLFTALHAAGHFDESRTAGKVIAPLLTALEYIHSKGIIHRDVKVENILLDLQGGIKLADFGLAIDCNTTRPASRLGTWEYMAPEIHLCPFKGDCVEACADDHAATYSFSVDCWAVGVLAYELLVGSAPFELIDGQMSYEDLMSKELVFPDSLSREACSFIRSALCKQAGHRPSARQLLQHRWLRPFLKANPLDGCATASGTAPERAPKSRVNQSLPLQVLHPLIVPAPAETESTCMKNLHPTPVDARAGGMSGGFHVGACLSPTAAITSSADSKLGLRCAALPSIQLPASPTTPLSCEGSTRTSQDTDCGDTARATAPASPHGRLVQLTQPRSSGALAAVAADLLRRLPYKIQSLMNLGGRAENQVQPLLPAATSWSLGLPRAADKGRHSEEPSMLQGSRTCASYDKARHRPGALVAAAGTWAGGPECMDEFNLEHSRPDVAGLRVPVIPSCMMTSSPVPASALSMKGPKASIWGFSNLGGRRSIEISVQHSASTNSARGPGPCSPMVDRLAVAAASQPSAGGQRRSMSADRDSAARQADPGCQTTGPRAPERHQPTSGSRPRRGDPAYLRSVTCCDLQQQQLLASQRQGRESGDPGPASPWLYQRFDVLTSIPGSIDGSLSSCMDWDASPALSASQIRSPIAAASGMSRDSSASASRSCISPSPARSGGEPRLREAAGQSLRGASRSRRGPSAQSGCLLDSRDL